MSQKSKKRRLKRASVAMDGNPRAALPVGVAEADRGVAGLGHILKQQASCRWPGNDWIIALLLFAALLLAYSPALRGGFLWDDDTYISANSILLTLQGLRAIWLDPSATCQYYPLSFTAFWVINHFFGLTPLAFHLVTLSLHAADSILFWQILKRLRLKGALLAGALFALHPVNVMSVAWMTELKNTLSCSLALGAAWAYVRFAGLGVYEQAPDSVGGAATKETPWRWYILSLVLFQLAMLAKTAVSFLPASLLLVVWWQRPRITRRDLLSLIPMLGISVGMGAFTIYIERHAGGASGAEFTIGFLDRVLISGRSFWFYLGKLVWPDPLIFIYPRWKLDAGEWWQWLYPLATLAALSAAWIARRRIGKGVFVALMHSYISTSMLVLMVVLYMMRYSFVADHWQYFGSLSIIALIASGITRAMDRLGEPWAKALEMGVGIVLVLGLGALTWAQTAMYTDIETLWRTTIADNPECWMAHNNLGLLLIHQGRAQEAIAQYRAAFQVNPTYADAHSNLGNALNNEGRTEEAIAEFREALRINPNYADAYNNLGIALFQQGHFEDAIAQYRESLRINPGNAAAHNNLANALFEQGRVDEAIAQYGEALQINPDIAQAHYNLGQALFGRGRTEEAIAHYRESLRINTANAGAHSALGDALFRQGQIDEAIAQYRGAIAINPADAQTQNNLGFALFKQGQIDQAIAEYRRALEIDPNDVQAHINLGNALLGQGDAAEALVHLQNALDLQPDNLALENKLAWILATAPQLTVRDGARAIDLATQASQASGGNDPLILRTLAAAYAQAGQYPNAVQTAQMALQLAQAQSNAALTGALPREIKLYEAGRPFEEAQ
jgi:tetratricopeptide (TPR) repeat protein